MSTEDHLNELPEHMEGLAVEESSVVTPKASPKEESSSESQTQQPTSVLASSAATTPAQTNNRGKGHARKSILKITSDKEESSCATPTVPNHPETRSITFRRSVKRLLIPTKEENPSLSDSSLDTEDEKELKMFDYYRENVLFQEWGLDRDEQEFVADFSQEYIATIQDEAAIQRLLFLAQVKTLLLSMDRQVLDDANRPAWPNQQDHCQGAKVDIIQQIEERLSQTYQDNASS